MSDEIVDIKRQQLESRKTRRDSENRSILEHFDIELDSEPEQGVIERCSDVEIALEDKPKPCQKCNGKGWVKPMFTRFECDDCFGTTYDLSNPIAVIKWQRLCMEWAKKDVLDNRQALRMATTTKEERQAEAVNEFYKHSKRCD